MITLQSQGPGEFTPKETTSVIVLAPLAGGLANGADFSNVSFADNGTTESEAQTGNLTPGTTYIPYEDLSTFADNDGAAITTWTLRISDISSPAVGYIKGGWKLEPLN